MGPLLVSALDAIRTERTGRSLIASRQRQRLAELVSYARTHSPYFKQFYQGLPGVIKQVTALPVTSKTVLMERFDDWVTDRAVSKSTVRAFIQDLNRVGDWFQGRYIVWTTSGSTGKPGIFLHDRRAMTIYASLSLRRGGLWSWVKQLARLTRRPERFAAIVATGGHFASAAGTALAQKTLAWGRNQYRAFSVLDPLPKLVHELNTYQPTDLMGYPSILALLAQEQQSGRLSVRPSTITSGSEGLEPAVRQLITDVFSCQLHDFYGSSEFPSIGFECSMGRQHVNADWVILEAVDEHYRPTPLGVPSRTTLLTNLANQIAPIIRYDLGDSLTWQSERCLCGSALPTIRMEGRRDEVLFIEGHAKVAILPLALGTVVEETPGVEMFQAIQTGPAEISIRLATRPGSDRHTVWQTVKERVQTFLSIQGVTNAAINLDETLPGRDPRTGKFREVWSAYHPERAG
jgi:phenylacetate-coenzyme A ligase PaaK-like adenylate-forming protein